MTTSAQAWAQEAARHHTTLSLLAQAANILNSSNMHESTQKLAARLTKSIHTEQQRQLKLYDKAMARIE